MFNAIEKSELKNLIVNNDMPESLSAQEKKRIISICRPRSAYTHPMHTPRI